MSMQVRLSDGKKRLSDAWLLAKDSASSLSEDKAPRLAAAIAFYTLLSLSPLLVLAVTVAGLAFGDDAARGQIAAQLTSLVDPQGASIVETLIENAKKPEAGVLSTIIGIVVLLFGASGVFGELQSSLDTIWRVE